MIRQLFRYLSILAVAWVALSAEIAVFAQSAGSGDSDPSAGDAKTAAKPPKPRQRVTMKLPDEYRSKDKDKDGQIGMYEWSRTDYATFRKLDLNGDGFITPLELSRAGRSKRSVSADVVSSTSGSGTSSGSERGSSTASTAPTVDTPAEGASETPTVSRSDAERQFDLVDKDKNGKITEEEFQKSIVTRLKFKNAGIALTFPVGRDEFLRMYPASK